MSTGTAQTNERRPPRADRERPRDREQRDDPEADDARVRPAGLDADGPVGVPRPVEAAELEQPPRRPERHRRDVRRVVADVVQRGAAELLLEGRLGDRADLRVDVAVVVDASQRPPGGGVLTIQTGLVVVRPGERRAELRADGDEGVQLDGVAHRPRRDGRQRDGDEQRGGRQRAPRPAGAHGPDPDREREEQDEAVRPGEDRQAADEPGQQRPAVARASIFDAGSRPRATRA